MKSQLPPVRWFILVIAGQSNAQGFGEALPLTEDLIGSPRIKQFGRFRGMRPDHQYEDRWNKIVDASHALDDVKDMRFANLSGNHDLSRAGTVGPGIFIARRLLDYLPPDAGILLLPQAHGGAGMGFGEAGVYTPPEQCGPHDQPGASIGRAIYNFPGVVDQNCNGAMRWAGEDSPLYLDLLQRLRAALQINPLNRLLGFVWVQGESDAHAGATYAERHSQHFSSMVDRLGERLSDLQTQFLHSQWKHVPWINVLATRWWDEALADHAKVIDGYRRLSQERPRQMHFLDLRLAENGAAMETNAEHFHNPAWPDYPQDVSPPLTDGRTCEPAMMHIHWSSGAYRGEVSRRIAAVLLECGLKLAQKN